MPEDAVSEAPESQTAADLQPQDEEPQAEEAAPADEPAAPQAEAVGRPEEPQANSTAPQEPDSTAGETHEEPQINVTIPEEPAETQENGTGEVPGANVTVPEENATTPDENATVPETNVTGPEANATVPEADATIPEENATQEGEVPAVILPVTEFWDSCMETCAIPALGRDVTILVEVEPGTVVYIKEIMYSYRVEMNVTNETAAQAPLSITIESPANESYGGAPVQLAVTTSAESLWCTYSLDDSAEAEMAMVSPTQFEHPVQDILPGPHYATFRCSDAYGNVTQSDTVYFSLTAPRITITIIEPAGDVDVRKNEPFPVTVEVTCSDADCGDVEVALDPYETQGGED
jgi:hypothetical protein